MNKDLKFKLYAYGGFIFVVSVMCVTVIVIFFKDPPPLPPQFPPLAEMVLQRSEAPSGFVQSTQTSQCNEFLTLIADQPEIPENCYQVLFLNADQSILLVSAAWEYPDEPTATSAFQRLTEIIPSLTNTSLSQLTLPRIGSESSGSLATIKGLTLPILEILSEPIYVHMVNWRYYFIVMRLVEINQNSMPENTLTALAQAIQARLP